MLQQGFEGVRAGVLPAAHGEVMRAVMRTDVEREDDAFAAETGEPRLDGVGLLYRERADDDAVGARFQQRGDVVGAADAAANLDGATGAGGQAGDECGLPLCRVFGAVEVNEVDLLRALFAVCGDESGGVAVVAGGLVVVALVQADDSAADEVKRGDDGGDPQRFSMKFCSRRAPLLPERSGWNCTP